MRITIDGKRYECSAEQVQNLIDWLPDELRNSLKSQLEQVPQKPRGRAKSYTAKQAEKMLELRNSGWTFQRIADKYGVSVGAVQRAIKDAEGEQQ